MFWMKKGWVCNASRGTEKPRCISSNKFSKHIYKVQKRWRSNVSVFRTENSERSKINVYDWTFGNSGTKNRNVRSPTLASQKLLTFLRRRNINVFVKNQHQCTSNYKLVTFVSKAVVSCWEEYFSEERTLIRKGDFCWNAFAPVCFEQILCATFKFVEINYRWPARYQSILENAFSKILLKVNLYVCSEKI